MNEMVMWMTKNEQTRKKKSTYIIASTADGVVIKKLPFPNNYQAMACVVCVCVCVIE